MKTRRRKIQTNGFSNIAPRNPMRNNRRIKDKHPFIQPLMNSFLYFVSNSVQRTLENIRSFIHGFLRKLWTNCVKNFVKKRVHERSSWCVLPYGDLRGSRGRVVAFAPRTTNVGAADEVDFPFLASNCKSEVLHGVSVYLRENIESTS